MLVGPSEIRIKPTGPGLAQIGEWCIIISLTCRADIDMFDNNFAHDAIKELIKATGLILYPKFVSVEDYSIMIRMWEYVIYPGWESSNTMEEIQTVYNQLQEAGIGISARSKEQYRY